MSCRVVERVQYGDCTGLARLLTKGCVRVRIRRDRTTACVRCGSVGSSKRAIRGFCQHRERACTMQGRSTLQNTQRPPRHLLLTWEGTWLKRERCAVQSELVFPSLRVCDTRIEIGDALPRSATPHSLVKKATVNKNALNVADILDSV